MFAETLQEIWWGRPKPRHRLMEPALAVASWFYHACFRFDQNRKLKSRRSLPKPVISVGNLTVGGTGKTPVTLWLAQEAEKMGKVPCILTRGYGGRSKKPRRVLPRTSRWKEYGDEPVLLARGLGNGCVYVGRNRYETGMTALEREPNIDLFLLDDGFQHIQLARDYDLLLIDGVRGFGNRRLLPWGPLREPAESFSRADFIGRVHRTGRIPTRQEVLTNPPEFDLGVAPVGWKRVGETQLRPLAELPAARPVHLVSGIGSPAGFEQTAAECGLEIHSHSVYPDHHPFTVEEVRREVRYSEEMDLPMATTAKDAIRMEDYCELWTPDTSPIIIELGLVPGDGTGYLKNVLNQMMTG